MLVIIRKWNYKISISRNMFYVYRRIILRLATGYNILRAEPKVLLGDAAFIAALT